MADNKAGIDLQASPVVAAEKPKVDSGKCPTCGRDLVKTG